MAKQIVKVEGLRQLEAALAELPKATGKAVLRRVLKAAAAPIYEDAKGRAPSRDADAAPVYYGGAKVGKGKRRSESERGTLRRPGTDEALVQSGTRLTRNQARLARKEGKDAAEHYVGSRDPIARLLEFGTANTSAQPVFRPAWDAHKGKALDIIATELGAEIGKAAARIAKKTAKFAAKG
jgi:HK97 gp10 family phage protein